METSKTVKKVLIDLELSVTDLSRGIGMSRPWTSQVLNGHSKSPEARKLILDFMQRRSERLGVKFNSPWPEPRKRKAA